jgi:hypothetical protein
MSKKPQSGKATSGGGIRTNKLVHPRHIGGQRTTEAVRPGSVDMLGQQLGFKRPDLIQRSAQAATRMGNDMATDVGRGGPGVGRVTHHCGSQGSYGTAARGEGGIQGAADRGERSILGPPSTGNPHPVVRRGQQRGE